MKFDIDHVETFLQVANLQSFSKAAAALNTTQPNISIRIAALEDALGKKLFLREKRLVKLTLDGHIFLEHAEAIHEVWTKARMAYFREQDIRGSLHLGVSETIVHVWLTDFLKEFSDLYPKVEINTHVDTSLHLREMLLSREIDCAFMLGPVSEPSLTNDPLTSVELTLACHESLGKSFTNSAKLSNLTFVTYSKHTKPSAKLFADLRALGVSKPRFIASSSLATNLELARNGVGLALLPKILVTKEIAENRLIEPKLPSSLKPMSLDFTVTFPTTSSNILIKQVARIAHEVSNKKLLSK